MIDVGQGDSILIHSNNESILFDTGGKMSFSEEEKSSIVLNTTIPLLKSLGIKKLNKKKIPNYQNVEEISLNKNKLYFLNTKLYDNENDNSSVIYTNINNNKILLMGDAGVDVEKELINKYNLEIDILKVGHHGSKTSSSKEFINYINPKISLISVGEDNKFNHPNQEVLEVLKNTKIYRTDKEGTITIKLRE